MKKLLAGLMMLVIALSAVPGMAEEAGGSNIANLVSLLADKDRILHVAQRDVCYLDEGDNARFFLNTISAEDMTTGEKASGLMLMCGGYVQMQYPYLDWKEAGDIIAMLDAIQKQSGVITGEDSFLYTTYTGIRFDVKSTFNNKSREFEHVLLITFGDGEHRLQYPLTYFSNLKKAFKDSMEALEALD